MNRGSGVPNAEAVPRSDASMRPRFMNRGSAMIPGSAEYKSAASMRPRFMNRGSLHERAVFRPEKRGFNEAPIHESGKSGPSERT